MYSPQCILYCNIKLQVLVKQLAFSKSVASLGTKLNLKILYLYNPENPHGLLKLPQTQPLHF